MNIFLQAEFSSIQVSHSVMFNSLQPHESQHARPPCPSPTPGVYPNPCTSSQWCHPAISFFVIPFSSCPQSFPASGSFQISQLFASGGQSIGVSASTSVLPMNTQDWSPLGWTGWISLQSNGLSRAFCNTTIQKASILWRSPFFMVQLSHPYMTTGKRIVLTMCLFISWKMATGLLLLSLENPHFFTSGNDPVVLEIQLFEPFRVYFTHTTDLKPPNFMLVGCLWER